MKREEKAELVYIIDEAATIIEQLHEATKTMIAAYNSMCDMTFGEGVKKLEHKQAKTLGS